MIYYPPKETDEKKAKARELTSRLKTAVEDLKNALEQPRRRTLAEISTNFNALFRADAGQAKKSHILGDFEAPRSGACSDLVNFLDPVPAKPATKTYPKPCNSNSVAAVDQFRRCPRGVRYENCVWNFIPDSLPHLRDECVVTRVHPEVGKLNQREQDSNVSPQISQLHRYQAQRRPDATSNLLNGKPVKADSVQQQILLSGVPYQDDIFNYLKCREKFFMPLPHYMKKQPYVTYRMRMELVDWLVEVAREYDLSQSTLFLTISIIDRFLSKMGVVKEKLQLLGSTAMFVASKVEDPHDISPMVSDFIYMTDDTYTREEVLKMEVVIVRTLNFNFYVPTVYNFIELIDSYKVVPEKVLTLAMFLCELTILDAETYLPHPPSLVASGAVALAYNSISNGATLWPDSVAHITGYTLKELVAVVKALNKTHFKRPFSPYQAIVDKYSSSEYDSVAKLPHMELRIPILASKLNV